MEKFDFFFGLSLGARISNLEACRRPKHHPPDEGSICKWSSRNCRYEREDSRYLTERRFIPFILAESGSKGLNEPQLPQRRNAPHRIEGVNGTAQAEFPPTVEAHYRTVYYKALDLVTSCIKTRFDQEDCKIHSACIESLLLKTVTDEDFTDELATVVQFYG